MPAAGKTVVALHRAAHLARHDPGARVLLATFTETLAAALRIKLGRLLGSQSEVARRISVRSMEGVGLELHEARIGPVTIATDADVAAALDRARAEHGAPFTREFLLDEWTHVVDAWNIRDGEAYASVPRLGRKTRVGGNQRETLWKVMVAMRAELDRLGVTTWSDVWSRLAEDVGRDPPFTSAVLDESQDLSVAELKFLAALAEGGAALFFAGDLGQRIFRQPFSWRALGVDIRGRSRVLKVNYRTSKQIRIRADRLLPGLIADGDGAEEDRRAVVSVFGGPQPEVLEASDADEEIAHVAQWLRQRASDGIEADEIGVVARTDEAAERGEAACVRAGLSLRRGPPEVAEEKGSVTVCTMPEAKGLEFRAVAVIGCDEDVVPLALRLETAANEGELREIYETERHLLYVACTRAREHLVVSGVKPVSKFLAELTGAE
jgi:superfamily I DNA/RNA helicase